MRKINLSNIYNKYIKKKKWKNFNRKDWKHFKESFYNFKNMVSDSRFKMEWDNIYPCLEDKTSNTGYGSHYTLHPAWAARILKQISPKKLVDISSYIEFIAVISAFIPVDFYDYRPAKIELSNLESKKADITALHFEDNSIDTLSCMHVIEHIGLGRYGDTLNPNGDLIAIKELKRVLAPGGNLLIVVPIAGIPVIQFNAHRLYTHNQIIEYFSDLKLQEFSVIAGYPEDYKLITNPSPELLEKQKFACGCYWFSKE